MVPNNDCRMLLSIIGARKTRNVLQRGGALDTESSLLVGAADRCRAIFAVSELRFQTTVSRRSRRRFGAIAEGELDDVVADIAWPAGNQFGKTPSVVCEQGSRGLLEMRKVAGYGRHEMIGRLARSAAAVAITTRAPRLFNELS
jgi:hypothetical protein